MEPVARVTVTVTFLRMDRAPAEPAPGFPHGVGVTRVAKPTVPFYRYLAVWLRNEDAYLDGDPALSTLTGRVITPEEVRQMHALVKHHH